MGTFPQTRLKVMPRFVRLAGNSEHWWEHKRRAQVRGAGDV